MLRLTGLIFAFMSLLSFAHAEPASQEQWFRASVNHVDAHVTVLLLTHKGRLYVRRLDLDLLDIPQPAIQSLHHRSEKYVPVSSIEGYTLTVEERSGRAYFYDVYRPHVVDPRMQTLLLSVVVNGKPIAEPLLFEFKQGRLIAPIETLKAMGIVPDKVWTPLLHGAMPLHAIAGESFSLDYDVLSLSITVNPQYLAKTRISAGNGPPSTDNVFPEPHGERPDGVSAVLGYNVVGLYDSENGTTRSGQYNLSISGSDTTCGTSYVKPPFMNTLHRLDSLCSVFFPDSMVNLSLGDTFSSGGPESQPIRFGGIHIGTDFGLQPGFVTLPTHDISGTARVPSTIEVWVDRMLTLRTHVPAGPFDIRDIPLHTGSGNIQANIITPTGTTRILEESFYADSALLASGLSQWGFDTGKLRYDYGLPNDRYSDPFGSFYIRHGFNEGLTASISLQATNSLRQAGSGVAIKLGTVGVAEFGFAHSTLRNGVSGDSYRWRLAHRGKLLNLSYQLRESEETYHELAYLPPYHPPNQVRQVSAGINISHNVSLSMTNYQRTGFDGITTDLRSISANIRLGDLGNLLLSAYQTEHETENSVYAAQLTIPLGSRTNVSSWAQRNGEEIQKRIGLQTNPPAGPGIGYRLETGSSGGTSTANGQFIWNTDLSQVSVYGQKIGQFYSGYADLSGSLLFSTDGISMSQNTRRSYAVVHVGESGIPVYSDGQLLAVSDGDGYAVLSGLRPFDRNVISIKPDDVPLYMQAETLKHVIIPGKQTVSSVEFGLSKTEYISGTLKKDNGNFVPEGALLLNKNAGIKSIIGSNGKFFFEWSKKIGSSVEIRVKWSAGSCHATLHPKINSNSVVMNIGVITCLEQAP